MNSSLKVYDVASIINTRTLCTTRYLMDVYIQVPACCAVINPVLCRHMQSRNQAVVPM